MPELFGSRATDRLGVGAVIQQVKAQTDYPLIVGVPETLLVPHRVAAVVNSGESGDRLGQVRPDLRVVVAHRGQHAQWHVDAVRRPQTARCSSSRTSEGHEGWKPWEQWIVCQ